MNAHNDLLTQSLLIAAVAGGLSCGTVLPTPRDEADMRVLTQDQLDRLVAEREVPGISYAVVTADHTVFSGAAGVMDAASGGGVAPTTLFMACSTTKVITGIAVLQLAEAAQLDIDAPLSTYIEHPYGDDVTAAMLLAHTSGVPNPMPLDWFYVEGEPRDHAAMYRAAVESNPAPADAPARRYRYSNLGYWLLEDAIERVSGKSYARYVAEHIFAPLGIEDSEATFSLPPVGALATGHNRKWRLGNGVFYLMTPSRYWAESAHGWSRFRRLIHHGAAYGGLYVSSSAFATILADLLRAESVLLGHSSKDRLFAEQFTADGKSAGGTLGWTIGETSGVPYFGKQGGALGFHGNVRLYPQVGIGTVFFANSTRVSPGPIDALSDRLDAAALQLARARQ